MTNLRPGASATWLTREKVLVGGPIALAVLISLGLVGAVVVPALGRVGQLKTEVVDLEAKAATLPDLQEQLLKLQQTQQKLRDQQTLLVDLIAGQDRIATFLALLEQEAAATAVTIVRYEPQASPRPSASDRDRRSSSSSQDPDQTPSDPMQALGYRQTAVILEVWGGYKGLQSFLQRMEDLEVLVEASDLELENRPAQDPIQTRLTQLALRLSFFDRAPEPESEGDDNRASTSDQ